MGKDSDIKKWTLLNSEYLIRRPWLTARRDHLQLPDGTDMPEYYVLEYPDWINIIAITKEGRFLLERQYRHGRGIVAFELPAGVIEDNETPLQAAQRELLEETGYTGGQWEHFMTLCPNAGACTNVSYTFLATGVEQTTTQHLEQTEDIAVYEMSRDEVFALLRDGQFHQALMAAPLWKYFFTHPE
ncbi:MAG: NUDIX hydrolase [Bacteroidaceae bacterium]|nr:NUDIX hydrolase [Bacteroidaceae bacterium]